MSFETNTQHFDFIGPGFVQEHHADEKHGYLLEMEKNAVGGAEMEKNAVGGAMAWLAFYATAVVVVVISNFQKAADIAVAAAN